MKNYIESWAQFFFFRKTERCPVESAVFMPELYYL